MSKGINLLCASFLWPQLRAAVEIDSIAAKLQAPSYWEISACLKEGQ